MLVHLRIHRQSIPYCLYTNGSGCLELNLETKERTKGQRVGPLSSQREQGYGNKFEGRFQAT